MKSLKRWMILLTAIAMLVSSLTVSLAETSVTAVRPQDDYYAAVNAQVLSEHAVGENSSAWNWFFDLEALSWKEQVRIITSAKAGETLDSEGRLAALYALAIDQDGRDLDGFQTFNAMMQPLMNAQSLPDFLCELSILQRKYDIDSFFRIEVVAYDENPGEYVLQLSDPATVVGVQEFMDVEAEEDIRDFYDEYLARLLVLSGKTEADAKKTTRDVFALVKDITKGRAEEAKYEKKPLAEVRSMLSHMDVDAFLANLTDAKPDAIYVRDMPMLGNVNNALTEESLPLLKDYIYLMNLQKFAPYMTGETANVSEAINAWFSDEEPSIDREETAAKQVAALLPWDLGKLYAEQNFTAEEQADVRKMIDDLLQEYRSMLNEEDWLSPETRGKAIRKLDSMHVRVGLPEDIGRYLSNWSPVKSEEGGSYLAAVLAIREEKSSRAFGSFGKPVDRTVWQIHPQELTPCYYPTDNSINIPVAVLEAPYYALTASREENLGAIGTIIGHEVTHAFDDLGSKYDEHGDFINWWTDADRAAFNARAQKIITYYSQYRTPNVMQQDGQQTLGENIADLGSMHCLTRIVERENLDAKRFFESFANSWASTIDDLSAAMVSGMDEHAADKVRVNAVLASNDLFYQIYGIKEGDGMYIKPEDRVSLW